MDKIGQRNRVIAIFYKENRIYTDKMKLNILRLLRGRSQVQILPGTPNYFRLDPRPQRIFKSS